MTTGERLRSYFGDRQIDGGRVSSFAGRYWQIGLMVALMALAAGLRLWDLGERAVHHDESIHVKFAWDITQQGVGQYIHDPVYHGPFQYFGTAATFIVFGDNDYTSRLFPALFGIALVGLPFLLRRQLGTMGTFVAAGLLAVSPALIYFSRFARNDIYVAFFTLAIVVCIWRFLQDHPNATKPDAADDETYMKVPVAISKPFTVVFGRPFRVPRLAFWLVLIAPLMAFSFAAKEVTYITVAILIVFLNIQVALDLVQQVRASRKMEPADTLLAYAVLLPSAWIVVALWPLIRSIRERYSLTEMPAAGPVLIIIGTIAGPLYAAGIQKVPYIVEPNTAGGEQNLMQITTLALIIGGAYFGVLWNWRVWLIAAALFYIPFVLLFTSFFANMPGFWSGIWGSMDYWLGQQGVSRGDQPDYYYFMLLPVYELAPLVFAIGGALFAAIKGKMEQLLIAGAALLLILAFTVAIPDSWRVIGEYRIQFAFIIAIAAVLMLSMETFTKFLLFWLLSMMFALTVAGEKMPWLTVHAALPLALIAAKVINDVFAATPQTLTFAGPLPVIEPAPGGPDDDGSSDDEPSPPLADWRPHIAGALSAVGATTIFVLYGPASGVSLLGWLLALAAAASVVWGIRAAADGKRSVPLLPWQVAGQVVVASLFAALLVFTIRAGVIASFDQGSPGGTPPEILIYAQGSPGLGQVAEEIARVARESGDGNELAINIDNSGNIWPWPWYLRDYSVRYDDFNTATPDDGAVVLISLSNQAKMEPFLDGYYEGIPYTHMWWFPELYKNLDRGDFLSDVFAGNYFGTWRGFFIDRTVPGATSSNDMVAFFPKIPGVPEPERPVIDSPEGSEPLPDDALTYIGEAGEGDGQFAQPAGMWVGEGGLFIADTLNHRVQQFTADGDFIGAFGEQGDGEGAFGDPSEEGEFAPDGPWGITVDAEGNIYVADTWNHRVQKFAPDFEFILEWGAGEFFGPRDLEINAAGNLLIVDTGNNRIVEYTLDGVQVTVHGGPGSAAGQFNEPSSISVAPNGDIYVADFWGQRIQHFDQDFLYIDEIEVPTWGSLGVTDRAYIVALEGGTVLATDPGNGRIIVFNTSGEEVRSWTVPGTFGASRPVGIASDGAGQIYIGDGLTARVTRVALEVLLAPPQPVIEEPVDEENAAP